MTINSFPCSFTESIYWMLKIITTRLITYILCTHIQFTLKYLELIKITERIKTRKSESKLRVPSPLACPVSLALVFEDDVLNLGFVLKYCLAIVLCLGNLILNDFAALDIGFDQLLNFY